MYLDWSLYHTICWATFGWTLYKTNIHLGVGKGEGRFGFRQILCYFNKNVVKSTLCSDTLIRWTPRKHVLPRVGPCLSLLLFGWLSLRQTSSWDGHWVPVPKVSVNCIKKFSQDVNLRKCKSPPHPSLQPSRAVFSHYRETVKRSSQIPLVPQVSVAYYKAVFLLSRNVPPQRMSIALRDNTGRLCSRLLVSGDVYRPVVFIMIASYSDISHYVT